MNDLDRALRDMLREREQDIRSVPAGLLTFDQPFDQPGDQAAVDEGGAADEVLDLGTWRLTRSELVRRRWPILLTAAAVVAIVTGLLLALAANPAKRSAPAHPEQGTTTVTRQACRTSLPASWRRPVEFASSTVAQLEKASIIAVTGSGGAVVEYDSRLTGDAATESLGYLPGRRSAVRPLGKFTVTFDKPGIHSYGLDADVDADTVLITVEAGGNTSHPRQIVAVNVATGTHTVLAQVRGSAHPILGAALVQDGVAYWQTRTPVSNLDPGTSGVAQDRDTIVSRPVDGGPSRIVARGQGLELEKSALGIEWKSDEGAVDRPAHVPALVARHSRIGYQTGEVFNSYVTDGTAYAWQTLQGDLDWYDASNGRLVRVPRLLGIPGVGPGQAALFAVAGPLVYYQNKQGDGDRVVDVRSGADFPVSGEGSLFGVHGTVLGDPSALTAVHDTTAGNFLRLDTGRLPVARC